MYSRLLNEPEIKEVYPLFGAYTFLVKIEAIDADMVGRIVLEKIRSIEGVTETMTLLEFPLHKKQPNLDNLF